jgi:hypothetical protein
MQVLKRYSISFRVAFAILLASFATGTFPRATFAQSVVSDTDASTLNQKIKDLSEWQKMLSDSMAILKTIESQVTAGNMVFVRMFASGDMEGEPVEANYAPVVPVPIDAVERAFRVDEALLGHSPAEAERRLARYAAWLKRGSLDYMKRRLAADEKKLGEIKAELSYLLEQRDRMPEANWAGTYISDDKETTITITALGANSISGSDKWAKGTGHGQNTWTGCTVTRNRLNCDWNGTYEDDDKSVARHGTVEFTLVGNDLTSKYTEEEPEITWKGNTKPYESAIHDGAIWTYHYKRQ